MKSLLAKTLLFLGLQIRQKFQSLIKNKFKGCFFVGNYKCISGMQKKTLNF